MNALIQNTTDADGASVVSAADLMDCIRDNAQTLADAVRLAQRAGIAVAIEHDEDHVLKVVYTF